MAYGFDPSSGRYRDGSGRFVNDAAIRKALDQVLDTQSDVVRNLTQQLIDGAIALGYWQAQMMQTVKSVHLIGLAVANGGWSQLDQADFGWVGQRIRVQYDFLAGFAAQLASGGQKLDGSALARAALYTQAGRETHREAQRRMAARRLVSEERRVLGRADHCGTCIQQARLGWQQFGTLRRIGDSECRANCRCHFEFRQAMAA